MNPISTAVKWLAILALLGMALVHFLEAPDSFSEITYKGVLFVANGVGAIVAAIGIGRGQRWGWLLGLLIAVGALVAYALSRTVGLPGLPAEPDAWFETMGVAAMVCEGLYVILFVLARRRPAGTVA